MKLQHFSEKSFPEAVHSSLKKSYIGLNQFKASLFELTIFKAEVLNRSKMELGAGGRV